MYDDQTPMIVTDKGKGFLLGQESLRKDVDPVLRAAWKLGALITTNDEVGTRVSKGWEEFVAALNASTEAQRIKKDMESDE